MSDTGGLGGDPCGDFGLDGKRPRRPFNESVRTTSLTMPTCKHFWNRQNWHLLRRLLSTGQFLSARQRYLEPFWTVLLKNPIRKNNDINLKLYILSIYKWNNYLDKRRHCQNRNVDRKFSVFIIYRNRIEKKKKRSALIIIIMVSVGNSRDMKNSFRLTFASFASANPVMLTRGRVTANGAQLWRRRRCHPNGSVPLRHTDVLGQWWTVVGYSHWQCVDAVPDFRRHTAVINESICIQQDIISNHCYCIGILIYI